MARHNKAGILIVSDRASAGVYQDKSAPIISRAITDDLGMVVEHSAVVPDEIDIVKNTLITWVDQHHLNLIFTSGGTGFAPRDITPEATRLVIQKETPGLVFAMLRDSLTVTPHAMLSRMAAGIRNQALIINLPGSPKAVRENLQTILPALPHALELLRSDPAAEEGHNRYK